MVMTIKKLNLLSKIEEELLVQIMGLWLNLYNFIKDYMKNMRVYLLPGFFSSHTIARRHLKFLQLGW
jgi:hypothetical protein